MFAGARAEITKLAADDARYAQFLEGIIGIGDEFTKEDIPVMTSDLSMYGIGKDQRTDVSTDYRIDM